MSDAIQNSESGLQVEGYGVVYRLLPDDLVGSRHQRIIVTLPSGDTMLIAHNIDLAPRIDDLKVGDGLTFYGEYKWNDLGGLLHWTHRDEYNNHVHGWIKYDGRMYQ